LPIFKVYELIRIKNLEKQQFYLIMPSYTLHCPLADSCCASSVLNMKIDVEPGIYIITIIADEKKTLYRIIKN